MPRPMISLVALSIALVSMAPQVAALQSADSQAAPIFVVRHAERADGGAPSMGGTGSMTGSSDPPLSAEGAQRAERLASMLRDAGITRVFATEFARTRQTAEPLAKRASVAVTVVPAKDLAGLVEQLSAAGGAALVVGHSNTVPEILKALGLEEPIRIADAEYDNLFIIVRGGGSPRLVRLKY